jgi:hypothetical protein
MRELYLGFYKILSYKDLIYISLAELISKNFGSLQNNQVKITRKHYFTKNEKKILLKIYGNINRKLFPSELENWYKEIKEELIEKNYLKKYPFFGYKFTRLFKKDVKFQINNSFNPNIVKFINSGKIECLKQIIYNIEEIRIPVFHKTHDQAWTYFYYDKAEMCSEALAHRLGSFDYSEKGKGIKYKTKNNSA